MEFLKVKDYLDEDVAYLLGSITARGQINYSEGIIKITYPYKYLVLDDRHVWENIVISLDPIVRRFKSLGYNVDKEADNPGNDIILRISANPESLQIRLLRSFFNARIDYKKFFIPEIIWEAPYEMVAEFIRGYADVAAHIRASNRDEEGFHRVYIDVMFQNWKLPVQLCNLIQTKLDVPVHTITWGHPNIRDPHARYSNSSWWKKEHQIKIYAHDFEKIGFYIKYKQELLENYIELNKKMLEEGKNPRHRRCRGVVRRRRKPYHPDEYDRDLPQVIRGVHVESYVQICKLLGCKIGSD